MNRVEAAVIAGCEPLSHVGTRPSGVVMLHGFGGNPSSMRGQATAFARAGHHVEQPRLPGHGTTIDDMATTGWADWSAEAAAAYDRLAERAETIVVMGQSMGGTLALWSGLARLGDPRLRGLICVNPVTRPQPDDVMEMLAETVDDGFDVLPGTGSDIADPGVDDIAYDGTPIRQLVSLVEHGVTPITDRFGELDVPLLLFTSAVDHAVPSADSEYLASTYGGGVELVRLERSFHVATLDFDRDLISETSAAFIARVGE